MAGIKEIAATVGFEVEDESKFDLNAFKEHLDKTYVPVDMVMKDETIQKKIVGKVLGSLTTKAAQEFDLKSGEVKDKTMEEIFGFVKAKYTGAITDLTEKANKGNDEKVTSLMKVLQEKEQELNLAKGGLSEWETKYNTDLSEAQGKLKGFKLDYKLGEVKKAVTGKFIDDYHTDELKREGFEKKVNETYLFELDEDKDAIIVKERKSGDLVKSKLKSGVPASPEEVYLNFAEEKGILKKNNADKNTLVLKKQVQIKDNNANTPFVHPNAQKRAGVA